MKNEPDATPEAVALNKILETLNVQDLNINSRGLLEGYIREAVLAAALDDTKRMDWLAEQQVEVRTRGKAATRDNFIADPGKALRKIIDVILVEERTQRYPVKLTYFKQSGKFYTEGEYSTVHTLPWDVCAEVRYMRQHGTLPGLREGAGKEFEILCEYRGVPYLLKTVHSERPEGA